MSSLKDQLAKLGMIDESQSNQDQRTPASWGSEQTSGRTKQRKPKGRDSRDTREQKPRGRQRSGGARRSAPAPQLDLSPEERAQRITELFERAQLPLPPYGHQRFYFELKGGAIDFVDTNKGSYDALTTGQVVIVADEQGRPVGLNRQAAQELRRLDASWIPANRS